MLRTRVLIVAFVVAFSWSAAAGAEWFIDASQSNGGDCPAVGTWDSASATCHVTSLLVTATDRLEIEPDTTLQVDGVLTNDGRVSSRGKIVVFGSLISNNDLLNLRGDGMRNHGTVFSHFMYNFAGLVNYEGATFTFDFFVENNTTTLNYGRIIVNGTFINIPRQMLDNFGDVEIGATGDFDNEGTLINRGRIDNAGQLNNRRDLFDHCSADFAGNPVVGDPLIYSQDLLVGASVLSWCAVPTATTYDVVRGDLAQLKGSSGDFALATDACVANDTPTLSVAETFEPNPGSGAWYAARANGVASASYDSFLTYQEGERTSEITASPSACP